MLKTGPYDIKVETPRIDYEFRINRKITIIRGNSGTGKSYLQNIIFESKDRESRDYITINSKVPLVAFRSTWETQRDLDSLASIKNSIIFLDEDYRDINTPEFARMVKDSSSYFVIITRSELSNLPYSIHEIYKINNSGKFNYLESIYEDNIIGNKRLIPDILIVEDSKSGYQFFLEVCGGDTSKCISSGGKSSIRDTVYNSLRDNVGKNVIIIADGAAFGNEILRVKDMIKNIPGGKILLYLPESFEYLLLNSPMIKNNYDKRELIYNPEKHVGAEYFSWELYFEFLLKDIVKETPAHYNKKRLSSCFTKRCCHLLGKEKSSNVPCKFEDRTCKTDKDKLYSILEQTGIDFSRLLGDDDIKPEKIKGF